MIVTRKPHLPHARRAALLLGLSSTLLLGACAKGDISTSGIPTDTRERHPIVLRDAPRSLDVFVNRVGGGLDPRQADDVARFGEDYRRSGKGGLVAEVPTGTGRDLAAHDTLEGIRRSLARAGVSSGALSVSTYRVADPGLASPIRLTYASLQAGLPHSCGQWPTDLGVSSYKTDATNEPYWNLGCATQANLAAQIADPLDLVRARSEGRLDTQKRMEAIKKLREGKDPSTQYRQEQSSISSAVGGK
ncbi:CpaD family pilus assembly protein [Bosea sp. NPDC055332]